MKQELKRKEIAAIMAVMSLIDSEEATVYQRPVNTGYMSPWSAFARSQTMQYRDLMQRRIIKRNR